MVPIEKSEKEVLDFHRSLQGWLSGSAQNVDTEFAPIETLLAEDELLSNLVFWHINQAATWPTSFTSIPSLNLIPVITFAR